MGENTIDLPIVCIKCKMCPKEELSVPISEIEAKVNITIVALLTLIAYNLIMDDEIPKLDYVTFMDTFIFITYLFTAAATILCVYSYYRYVKYRRTVNLVDHYSKFLGPIFYVISMIFCAGVFF